MIPQVVGWVESSAPHYAAAAATAVAIGILALVGAGTGGRWVWQRTREDVLWLAGWAARRRWNRSTAVGPVPPHPMASVGPIEDRAADRPVRDTFGPVAKYGPVALPKREPHHVTPPAEPTEPDSTDLFDGPYTAGPGNDLGTAVIAAASRLCRQAVAGGGS